MWWVTAFFVYIPTDKLDTTMSSYRMPVRWYWEKLQSETMGWTAAFYYSNMFVYLISVLEMIAWCMYITGDVWYLM